MQEMNRKEGIGTCVVMVVEVAVVGDEAGVQFRGAISRRCDLFQAWYSELSTPIQLALAQRLPCPVCRLQFTIPTW